MRRLFVFALALAVLLGLTVPAAYAQAPAPKVTINGLIDTMMSISKNIDSADFSNDNDTEWYGRTRGRFDIIGEVGKAKGVLGLEYDLTYGQSGASDTTGGHAATRGGFDSNTDVLGVEEVKWLYIEFPVPLIPVPMTMRIGAQPFSTTYKLAALATGDFAGISWVTQFSPNVKWNFTYAQFEENLTKGARASCPDCTGGNGDDFAIINSVEITPIKGLDIRPTVSVLNAWGATNGAVKVPAGRAFGARDKEERYTIGVDARWRSGPFSLDPTLFYQFGDSESGNGANKADIDAWFFDVIGGWRLGPLLLEGRFVYVTGNEATDDVANDEVNFYTPISADTSYFAGGWGEFFSLGIDYFHGAIRGLGNAITLDRYGRMQAALRAIYSVTPAFDVRAVVSALWTAEDVAIGTKTEDYVGTEINAGITWRFAPGLALDVVGAYLFAGGALDSATSDAEDAYTFVTRVRYTF
jgi:hypothetical protein